MNQSDCLLQRPFSRCIARCRFAAQLGSVVAWFAFGVGLSGGQGWGQESEAPEPQPSLETQAATFFESYCVQCHAGEDAEGGLALDQLAASPDLATQLERWERILQVIDEGEMPPSSEPQPTPQDWLAFESAVQAEIQSLDCASFARPGRVTIRRLNRAEYNNTIRDLLGIEFRPADDFPADDVGHGFDNIGDVLAMPPLLTEKYFEAAEAIVSKVWEDDAARQRILIHQAPEGPEQVEAARKNIAAFAERAFRRPPTDAEVNRLVELMIQAYQAGFSPEESFQAGMQAVLVSPHFLFKVEADPAADDPDGIRELNDYELASRLSYFLWSSMPDETLFELARTGQLRDPEVLKAQATRMLQDPKAQALTENFAGQWLNLRSLDLISPNPAQFPQFDDALREAMRRETELFFDAMVREDRNVLEFLTADFSFLNERLAQHYGISGIEGSEFQRVALNDQRRGVVTQASILLLTSNPTRTSPVKRGKWILDNILGEPPPPPPAGVTPLDEAQQALGTLRERMEEHRTNEACAVCHRKMDTLGFGLENFDVTGQWRTHDGRFEIDSSGSLPGDLQFGTASELMNLLAEEKADAFRRCLTEKMLTYALGRGLESYDRCAINQILDELAHHENRFSVLIHGIVTSEPFLKREGKGDR